MSTLENVPRDNRAFSFAVRELWRKKQSIFFTAIERRKNSNREERSLFRIFGGKKKKKKNGGTGVFNYKNIVPGGLLFVQL